MIGIFDSGSGGLTVFKAVREHMPSADIVYFGDIKNAPYGSKSNSELSLLTVKAIELLKLRGAESIVSACNSVSASLAVSLFDALSITPKQLIEMVGPTVSAFKNSSARLLLAATPATIQSGIYQNAFRMLGKDVHAVAVPELAAAIEFGSGEEEIETLIKSAFTDVSFSDYDVLILACTHYPLVSDIFARVVGTLPLFDPATVVGERVKNQLWPREVGEGTTHFLISKDSDFFRARAAELVPPGTLSLEVVD